MKAIIAILIVLSSVSAFAGEVKADECVRNQGNEPRIENKDLKKIKLDVVPTGTQEVLET